MPPPWWTLAAANRSPLQARETLNVPGSLGCEAPPGPASALTVRWSREQIYAWIISEGATNVLTPEMLPKTEQAEKELARALKAELNRALAKSSEIDRAVVEGRTPSELSEGAFRISGLPTTELTHLLRTQYLTPE